jgi:hypothetical protein
LSDDPASDAPPNCRKTSGRAFAFRGAGLPGLRRAFQEPQMMKTESTIFQFFHPKPSRKRSPH